MSAFRTRATLDAWVTEFQELHYPISGALRVIEQDGTDGSDTGLVKVGLLSASTGVYIQPAAIGETRWVATMEAREHPIELSAPDLMNLASELTTVSALCAFLQAKSTAYLDEGQA